MRKFLSAVGAALLLASLAGCIGSGAVKTPVPTPSATPVFASDEEALAAAEAAYAAYLKVDDAISADGGENSERLAANVTPDELRRSTEQFESYKRDGIHTDGASSFDSLLLQHADDFEVGLYLCLDVSDVRVLNAKNVDVTPPERVDRVPLEVQFVVDASHNLLLGSSDVWPDGAYCAR